MFWEAIDRSKDTEYYSCFPKHFVHRVSMSDPLLDGAGGHVKCCFMDHWGRDAGGDFDISLPC